MTPLLELAIERIRALPPARQDEVARMMMFFASDEMIILTSEEETDLRKILAEMVRRGSIAETRAEEIFSRRRSTQTSMVDSRHP